MELNKTDDKSKDDSLLLPASTSLSSVSTRAGSAKPLIGHIYEDYGILSIVEILRVIAWKRGETQPLLRKP